VQVWKNRPTLFHKRQLNQYFVVLNNASFCVFSSVSFFGYVVSRVAIDCLERLVSEMSMCRVGCKAQQVQLIVTWCCMLQWVSATSTLAAAKYSGKLTQQLWTVLTSPRLRSAAGIYTSTTRTTSRKVCLCNSTVLPVIVCSAHWVVWLQLCWWVCGCMPVLCMSW